MAKKHFMIYYKKGTGTYITTEPRPWSRENQNLFPNFNFVDNNNSPNTNFIENLLTNDHNFIRVYDDDDVTLIQNINPNLDL
jgi:hypothetical protein